ncbi:MAG: bacteriophage holin [Pseudonocardiaceae bacterium]
MPFLISMLAAAVGVVMLFTVLVTLRGRVRRMSDTVRRSRDHLADRTGMLAARIAALRVALNQRRHRNGDGSRPAPAA